MSLSWAVVVVEEGASSAAVAAEEAVLRAARKAHSVSDKSIHPGGLPSFRRICILRIVPSLYTDSPI